MPNLSETSAAKKLIVASHSHMHTTQFGSEFKDIATWHLSTMLPNHFVPDYQNSDENQHWVHWAALKRVHEMNGFLVRTDACRDGNEEWVVNMEAFRLGTGLEAVRRLLVT